MTEGNVDSEVIKKTQETLGKFVKKPPLTEKLLKKPPFKFILDIVKAVIRDTNFLEDLYSEEELSSEKDRDGKIKFLQKLIDVVKIVTQQDLQVKTSKIVAGLEADKTNELFQAIAYALENKLDSKEAVSAVKNGNSPSQTKIKTTTTKSDLKSTKIISKSTKTQPPSRDQTPSNEKKKLPSQRNSLERKPSLKEKEKPAVKEKVTTRSKVSDKKVKKVPSKEVEVKQEEKVVTNGSIESHNSITPPRKNSQEEVQVIENKAPELEVNVENIAIEEPKVNGDANHNHVEEPEVYIKPQDELAAIIDEEAEYRRKEKEKTKKLSSRHRQKSVEDEKNQQNQEVPQISQPPQKREHSERPRTSLRPPSARPTSSRPAAPRRRDKNVEIVLQPDESIKLANISVKMESFTKELEDDGENLIIIEDPSASGENFLDSRLTKDLSAESNDTVNSQEDHGHLVQQILETEKNFESALGMEGMENKKTEIEFDDSKIQSNVKQIEHLKEVLQKLVRSVNPMGKLMDFIQEDIDSMQREYGKWTEVYKQASIDLKREQNETLNAVEPLKFQLTQLEKMIIDHHQQIDQLRGSIVMHEQRINKIFTDL